MNKLNGTDFQVYSAFVNCLARDPELSVACKARENNIIVSKLKEYFLATILKGTVAFDVGCDIVDSVLFPNKKIEVKSTEKSIIPTRKTKYQYLAKDIIITNKFVSDGVINIKSDLMFFNFEKDRATIFCLSKDLEDYIRPYQNKLYFNTKHLENIVYHKVNWEDAEPMSRTCVFNLLKYCASPLPEIEYGKFEDYLSFCTKHDLNHFELVKKQCHTINLQK